ncbi:2-dehydro-3-deoxygalactonokinase [Phaeobacter sp. HF9A]|uniref:2-dehydro-3-deoxygalactonokinase n=1 Tax=Phaeobacter sp. HF9A TaxID=2721561 RepID=UPI00143091F0|nr:2-dehydro-3-deoxygalactonokinase [Phaeobacter sp. HF9A]NIZ15154.1 2-dehydro-3-deoxygalactonokinase [Phaeobacter sp. HF9A]
MSDPTMPTWIAFDAQHCPPRAWRMAGSTPRGEAIQVDTVEDARTLIPGADLVMAGAPDGEAHAVPAKPATLAVTKDPAAAVWRVASLSQTRPFGRMEGAACHIDGFLSLNKDWDGVICLPGFQATHWALISAEEVVSFASFATAPMVQALCPVPYLDQAPNAEALANAAQDVLSQPETLALRLAETRAKWAAGALDAHGARSESWGAALGAELAASRAYWLGQNLAVIGPKPLAAPYLAALRAQYVPVTETDETRMLLTGLARAYARRPQP